MKTVKTQGKYILKGKKAVKETDLLKWAKWFETNNRIVRKTEIIKGIKVGKKALGVPIRISTVFLGMNHSFGSGKPLLFETMIFGGEYDNYQERYSTWEDAEKGHKIAVELVKRINKS